MAETSGDCDLTDSCCVGTERKVRGDMSKKDDKLIEFAKTGMCDSDGVKWMVEEIERLRTELDAAKVEPEQVNEDYGALLLRFVAMRKERDDLEIQLGPAQEALGETIVELRERGAELDTANKKNAELQARLDAWEKVGAALNTAKLMLHRKVMAMGDLVLITKRVDDTDIAIDRALAAIPSPKPDTTQPTEQPKPKLAKSKNKSDTAKCIECGNQGRVETFTEGPHPYLDLACPLCRSTRVARDYPLKPTETTPDETA